MNKGVVYIASGEKYLQEVSVSVDSLRRHMPEIPVTVITTESFDHPGVNNVDIVDTADHDYGDGIINSDLIPYDYAIRLDTDTYICDNFSELFDVLKEFDVGLTVNPVPRYYKKGDGTYVPEDIPAAFPLFNGGVVLFKQNNKVKEFLNTWEDIYYETLDQNNKKYNQPSLRESLYKSDVRIFPISSEYNCWIRSPGYVCGQVKIVHGRHPNLPAVAKKINASTEPRCYSRSSYPIAVSTESDRLTYRIQESIDRHGITGMLKRAAEEFRNKA